MLSVIQKVLKTIHKKSKLKWNRMTAILFILVIYLILHSVTNAQVSDYIQADVKISICGNHLSEGGEECDNEDLSGEDCISFGFDGGELACDFACDFDTSNCYFEEVTQESEDEEVFTEIYTDQDTPIPVFILPEVK